MNKLRILLSATLLAASSLSFAASPSEPKMLGTVGAIVMDSSISSATQSEIDKVLKAQRIEAGKPVSSRQFLLAAALVGETTEGQYSAVWRRAKGSEQLTLHIGKTGAR